jgi:hypothetical protein
MARDDDDDAQIRGRGVGNLPSAEAETLEVIVNSRFQRCRELQGKWPEIGRVAALFSFDPTGFGS